MSGTTGMQVSLQPAGGGGWRLGFRNLLARENRKWWGGRRWLFQGALWTLLLNGLLVMVLFVIPGLAAPDGGPVMEQNPLKSAVQGFFSVGAVALALGATVLAQDEIVGEKQSGTAEWVLSKPASRSAFLLSKLVAHTLGVLVSMIALPGLVAYAILGLTAGGIYPPAPFLSAAGLLFLHVFFYLALTLALGVLAESRGLILAVSLGSILGGSFLRNILPYLGLLTPWTLPDIAGLVAMGEAIPALMITPIVVTAIEALLLIAVSLWQFQRYEF